jgi:hypothetical protein
MNSPTFVDLNRQEASKSHTAQRPKRMSLARLTAEAAFAPAPSSLAAQPNEAAGLQTGSVSRQDGASKPPANRAHQPRVFRVNVPLAIAALAIQHNLEHQAAAALQTSPTARRDVSSKKPGAVNILYRAPVPEEALPAFQTEDSPPPHTRTSTHVAASATQSDASAATYASVQLQLAKLREIIKDIRFARAFTLKVGRN